jgi:hypothetical protein
MPKKMQPADAAKRAVLSDSATLEALGRVVAECGLAWTPVEILVGALAEVNEASLSYDREKLEKWRKAGEKILGERGKQSSGQRRGRPRKSAAGIGEKQTAAATGERAPASHPHEQPKESAG